MSRDIRDIREIFCLEYWCSHTVAGSSNFGSWSNGFLKDFILQDFFLTAIHQRRSVLIDTGGTIRGIDTVWDV